MTFFHKFFHKTSSNQSNNTISGDIDDVTSPIISPAITKSITATYPELKSLSKKVKGDETFSPLSPLIQDLMSRPQLSLSLLKKIKEKNQDILAKITLQLEECTKESGIFTKYISLCKKMATTTFSTHSMDYENYNLHEELLDLEHQRNILQYTQKFADALTTEETIQIQELIYSLTELAKEKINIDTFLTDFLTLESTLKTDIESYSLAITEASTKHKISPDWNGKKQPLIKVGVQLTKRRDEFVKQEILINQKITKLYERYSIIYEEFQLLIPILIPLLELNLREHTINAKSSQQYTSLSKLYENGLSIISIIENLMEKIKQKN